MVLKGGTLKFLSQNQDEIEKKLTEILLDYGTTIEYVAQNIKTSNAVSFVFKITVDIKFKSEFEGSGPLYTNAQLPTVIILKLFVYSEKGMRFVENEVNTQKDIDALQKANSTQICPSVLYVKDIDGTKQEGTIDGALFTLLRTYIVETESTDSNGTVTSNSLTIYEYIVRILNRRFPGVLFRNLQKKAFFMEFLSCKSLLEFCEIPQYFDEGKLATSIDAITLTIDHTPNTPNLVLGLDKDSFKKLALHYITLKLFKLHCIHGDLHASNVYVLLDGNNIVFLIIDLGAGSVGPITNSTHKLDIEGQEEGRDIARQKDVILDKLKRNFCFRRDPEPHARHLMGLYFELNDTPDINLTIESKITANEYFDAAVMINMCIPKINYYQSTLIPYFTKYSVYMPLYCDYKNKEIEALCNQIIEQCLYSIPVDESPQKIAMTTGGGFIYKNRINKFITSKQINNKSKKRKNKTRNTKKSRKITMKKRRNRTKK